MSPRVRISLSLALATTALAAALFAATLLPSAASAAPQTRGPRYSVLVFTRTTGFRHDSIPAGIDMIRRLGAASGFAVEATEDPGQFAPANLGRFAAVVFLNTTGDVLNAAQQSAFEGFIRAGNGFVGIHSAADTEYDWPFYGELVGAYFASHPAPQTAAIRVEDRSHPSTQRLPDPWVRFDEWYNFRRNPRPFVRVLATLDERTYSGGAMGADHPIAWCRRYEGGRAFYTGGGHTRESYVEPDFERHVLGGIEWAANGLEAGGRGSRADPLSVRRRRGW